ncbi:MAG TPA: PfkB family carbohydrate kinase [Candidatus Lokiarchaeia archaeon]|nr:PfkB family carbohydrate kinase [Candidatus Lokiarchaeia archaeon]
MKKAFDLVILGHMAMDTVIHVENGERKVFKTSAGGAVTFGSIAAKTSEPGARIGIATKVGKDLIPDLLDPLKAKKIDLSCMIVDEEALTTRFELIYEGGHRTVSCPARCSALSFDDFPDELWSARRFHIGSICGEISLLFIEKMGNGIIDEQPVGIDLQGVLRDVHDDGTISLISQGDALDTTRKIYEIFGKRLVIKGDDFECTAVSGIEDPVQCIEYFLSEFSDVTVLLTMGRKGSYLGKNCDGNATIEKIPAFKPDRIVDETGAGDTYLVSYLSRIDNASSCSFATCEEAALFASAASSFLVEDKKFKGLQPAKKILERVQKAVYF